MRGTVTGPWAVACLLAAMRAESQVVINELLPDPAGADAGCEFVELLNTGAGPVALEGLRLEFANGAEGPVWQVRWTGAGDQVLAPGARFLVVDRGWSGAAAADAEVALALQNGPDAIRIVRGDQVLDLVGYGALADTLLMEARPVPVATGRSLARRPDGHDTGDNRADFVSAEPSPGAPNFASRALVALETVVEPPSLAGAGSAVTISARLRNDGVQDLPTVRVRLACGPDTVGALLDAAASGQERLLEWQVRPQLEGQWPLRLRAELADPAETLEVDLGRLQVGPAALRLAEVLGAPRSGQGEWVELEALGAASAAPGAYRLRDEDGDWVELPPLVHSGGGRVVVAEDSLALAGWLAANRDGPPDAAGCGAPVRQLSPWPALNNSPPEARTRADRVLLADSLGTILDHVDLGADGQSLRGDRSLERTATGTGGPAAGQWAESLAAAGSTPGCPNSVDPPPGGAAAAPGALTAEPAVLARDLGQAAVHLRFEVPATAAGWDLGVYDLDGRIVRDLGGDGLGAGPRALFWDLRDDRGRPVAAGGYVAVVRWRAAPGGGPAPGRRLLVVR